MIALLIADLSRWTGISPTSGRYILPPKPPVTVPITWRGRQWLRHFRWAEGTMARSFLIAFAVGVIVFVALLAMLTG